MKTTEKKDTRGKANVSDRKIAQKYPEGKYRTPTLLALLDGHDCHLSEMDGCTCMEILEELQRRHVRMEVLL